MAVPEASTTAVTQQPVVNHLHHQRFHHGSVRLAAAEQTNSEGSDGQHLSHHLMPQQLSVGLSGMEQLLVGLEQHDDERQALALAAHEATLRVKDTHAALKLSLEPLTFAYGEDDGQEYFEKILNTPEA